LRTYIQPFSTNFSLVAGEMRSSTRRQSAMGVSPPRAGDFSQKKKIFIGHVCW
jgi:hypothetical protein